LFDAGVVARQEWEASQASAEKAQADLRAAQAQAQAQGQPSAGGLTPLRSPIGGVVTRVDLRVGGFVSQGAPVAEITDARGAEYVFEAPPAVAASIRSGQTVRVQLPDGQDTSATITAVAPSAASAGAATVRARPLGPPPPFGAIVSARVVTAVGIGSIVVTSEAVQTLNGRSVVFVAEPKGFRARPVVAGRVSAGTTEILKGLQGAERIAGKGAFLLKAELGKGEAGHED
jgi:cobalt-zinc-cadmium efflux system membrane fusion protein